MIRPIDPESDLPAVAAIEAECFEDPWSLDDYREQFRRPGCGGLIFEAAGRPVAHLIYWPSDGVLYVGSLAVLARFRRRGYGRRLLRHLIRGGPPLSLHVRAGNRPARALYRSLGFSALRAEPGYYGPGPDDDALLLLRP